MLKIKNFIYTACAAATLSLAACDNVDEKDRYIEVEPVEASRSVLVEEFSGERCVNCPDGAEILHGLQETYGADTVIVVTIHAGSFGLRPGEREGFVGLVTDQGEELCSYHGVNAFPSAVIDRRSGVAQNMNEWQTLINSALAVPAYLDLDAEAIYNNETNMIDIKVTGRATNDITGKLHVWITEDGIVGGQFNTTGGDWNYVHNHIFRASVNNLDGTSVSYSFEGEAVENTFSIECSEDWNAANLNVVAFVDNANGVEQTTTTKVN